MQKQSRLLCCLLVTCCFNIVSWQNVSGQRIDSTAIYEQYRQEWMQQDTKKIKRLAASLPHPDKYDFYVSTTGSDSNPGTKSAPFRTIQHAINISRFRYIKVADGRYEENLKLNNMFVKLIGNPNSPQSVVIDGKQAGSTIAITNYGSPLICGFTVTGGIAVGTHPYNHGGGIFIAENSYPTLSDLIVTGNYAIAAPAIAVMGGYATIENVLIYGNTCPLVQYIVRVHYAKALLRNVTITGNHMIKASLGASGNSVVEVKNSILWDPAALYEIEFYDGTGKVDVAYSDVRGGEASVNYEKNISAKVSLNEGMVDANPLFVAPVLGKYQLREGSPCIDAGDPASEYNDVYFPPCRGTNRNDIGTYGGKVSMQPYQSASLKVTFEYDESGNQYERTLYVTDAGKTKAEAVATFNEYQPAGTEEPEPEPDPLLYNRTVTIYPNPTRGMLRVDITGGDIPAGAMIYLYHSSGTLIRQWTRVSATNEMDLSDQPEGLYIMRILLGNEVRTWKIVKN